MYRDGALALRAVGNRRESLLKSLANVASGAGIFCDFDGCLAPIVEVPEDARAVRGTGTVLARLAQRFAVVAVISGRPVSFLSRRIRAKGVRLVGLYGIEQRVGGRLVVDPEAEGARAAIEEAVRRLTGELRFIRGVVVEHKGLAATVHFRRAADPEEAQARAEPIVDQVARSAGFDLMHGRKVLEIRPRAGGDKGDALRHIVRETGVRAALVAGDDVGDLASFAAVSGLSPAVRVAVGSDESPPELLHRADVVVGSPAEFVELLSRLADETGP